MLLCIFVKRNTGVVLHENKGLLRFLIPSGGFIWVFLAVFCNLVQCVSTPKEFFIMEVPLKYSRDDLFSNRNTLEEIKRKQEIILQMPLLQKSAAKSSPKENEEQITLVPEKQV